MPESCEERARAVAGPGACAAAVAASRSVIKTIAAVRIRGMLHWTKKIEVPSMRRMAVAFVIASLFSSPVLAVDAGKAEGAVIVDGTRIGLAWAYAVDHQKNELTMTKNDTRIVLTDKPLPDGVKLDEIDYSFPEGTMGVVICIARDEKVSHVVVQHPKGMYDAGYFDSDRDYHFKPMKSDPGTIAGSVSSRKITTNTMTFSLEVDFNAVVK